MWAVAAAIGNLASSLLTNWAMYPYSEMDVESAEHCSAGVRAD